MFTFRHVNWADRSDAVKAIEACQSHSIPHARGGRTPLRRCPALAPRLGGYGERGATTERDRDRMVATAGRPALSEGGERAAHDVHSTGASKGFSWVAHRTGGHRRCVLSIHSHQPVVLLPRRLASASHACMGRRGLGLRLGPAAPRLPFGRIWPAIGGVG